MNFLFLLKEYHFSVCKMELWHKVAILLTTSLIFTTTNGVATVYNLYLYKKKDCRGKVINNLFSQLCVLGHIGSLLMLAMILHHLEIINTNWSLMVTIRSYQGISLVHFWMFVAIATAVKQFSPTTYTDISNKDNYLGLLLANVVFR